jgi:hypothetical protein
MVEWSIEAFRAVGSVGSIVIAVPPGHVEELGGDIGDGVDVVAGGATRAQSVSNALEVVGTELVAIHDGARPLVTPELIEGTIATLVADPEASGAVAATPITDTIKQANNPQRCSLAANNAAKEQRKGSLGGIVERRELEIHRGKPERRAMAFTRTASGLCVANLHATNDRPEMATEDVLLAARAATEWAGDEPLLFGGDLNLRPAENPALFAELRDRFGLGTPTTAPRAIDHLLGRGLEVVDLPVQWPPERREVRSEGLALRLSDHAPVEARFATPQMRG